MDAAPRRAAAARRAAAPRRAAAGGLRAGAGGAARPDRERARVAAGHVQRARPHQREAGCTGSCQPGLRGRISPSRSWRLLQILGLPGTYGRMTAPALTAADMYTKSPTDMKGQGR
jgi:hypothetical protein